MSALDDRGFPGKFEADVSGPGGARGYALIAIDDDLTEMGVELHVEGVSQPTQATIHLTRGGSTGPIVVWLYPTDRSPRVKPGVADDGESVADVYNGFLGKRVIGEDELVGPLGNAPLEELVELMLDGNASIEVYSANVGIENAAGEMSGQIEPDFDP
ncbi:CHRD domain-containing protein [Natronorarus salvus]|uniref:CHRD domain-containing protein n=1 Tax=Natronorarus salvus TaxID=3117733 RepID=UPI002F263802